MLGSGQGSLFDRLEDPAGSGRERTTARSSEASIQTVKRHVEQLLNSRQGGSQSSPSVGLPDFNDAALGSSDLLLQAAIGIRAAIEDNEPRIRVGAIRLLPNDMQPLQLGFRVDCNLVADDAIREFEMDLMLNSHTRHYSAT